MRRKTSIRVKLRRRSQLGCVVLAISNYPIDSLRERVDHGVSDRVVGLLLACRHSEILVRVMLHLIGVYDFLHLVSITAQ